MLFVVILAASMFVASTPSPGQSSTKIMNYYLNHSTQLKVDGLLTYLAIVAGLWFYASLWRYFRSFRGMEVPAVVTLVGAALFAVGGSLGAGLDFVGTDHTSALGTGNIVVVNNLSQDLFFPMIIAGLCLFYLAAGIIIFRARAFPRWLAWVSWVFAVTILVPPTAIIGFFGTPLWLLVACFCLWRMPAKAAEAVAAAHPAPTTLVEAPQAPAIPDAEYRQPQ